MPDVPDPPSTTDELRQHLDDLQWEQAAEELVARAIARARQAGLAQVAQMLAGSALRAAVAGQTEDEWLIGHARIAMIQALESEPHANAGSRLDQIVAILKDHQLWPWYSA